MNIAPTNIITPMLSYTLNRLQLEYYVILSLNAEFLKTFSNFILRFHVRIRLRRLVHYNNRVTCQ